MSLFFFIDETESNTIDFFVYTEFRFTVAEAKKHSGM
jgi:hypothetical protein